MHLGVFWITFPLLLSEEVAKKTFIYIFCWGMVTSLAAVFTAFSGLVLMLENKEWYFHCLCFFFTGLFIGMVGAVGVVYRTMQSEERQGYSKNDTKVINRTLDEKVVPVTE